MKQFKGTPGPWVIKPEEVDRGYIRVRGARLGGRYKVANVVTPQYEGVLAREAEETRANANLIAAAPELLEALQWALPLAKIAMDTHRMERIKCGHVDINGTYKNGETWAGIYQKEVDEIESAQAAIAKALGL